FVTAGAERVARVSLTSTTVAPGTTAPDGSFTLPDTVPVVICATAGNAMSTSPNIRPPPTKSTLRSIVPPSDDAGSLFVLTHAEILADLCVCNRLHGATIETGGPGVKPKTIGTLKNGGGRLGRLAQMCKGGAGGDRTRGQRTPRNTARRNELARVAARP